MPHGRWDLRRKYGRRASIGAVLLLSAGLIAAFLVGFAVHRHNELERERRFDMVVRVLARNISERMGSSDDADKIDHALLICAPRLPPPLQEDLQRAVDDFDFRRAEATLRDWQANHPR